MAEKGLVYVMDMESGLSDSLIRRVVDMGQYHVFRKWDMEIDAQSEVATYGKHLRAIILSGSAKNVNSEEYNPPQVPIAFINSGVPILAICYGMQFICSHRGVPIIRCWNEKDPEKRTKAVKKRDPGEQGPTHIQLTPEGKQSILFKGLGDSFPVWMKHKFMAEYTPPGWTLTASTDRCPVAAVEFGNIFGVQFHPEPYNSLFGRIILHNFLTYACSLTTPYF